MKKEKESFKQAVKNHGHLMDNKDYRAEFEKETGISLLTHFESQYYEALSKHLADRLHKAEDKLNRADKKLDNLIGDDWKIGIMTGKELKAKIRSMKC